MPRRICPVAALLLVAQMAAAPAGGQEFGLVPGHVYGVIQGGVQEWDSELKFIAPLTLPNVSVTEGVAFTPRGTLVLSAFLTREGRTTHHVLEIDADGTVVSDVDLNEGSLDRAAHAAVDSQGRIYTAAFRSIVEIQPDFSSWRKLDHRFSRSSGVAVGADDRLYVTDQEEDTLVIFDAQRELERSFRIGSVPTGLSFNPAGELYVTLFRTRTLSRIDLENETVEHVLAGLDDPSDVKFAADGSYYLSLERGNRLEWRDAANQLLISVRTGHFTDALAVMPVAGGCVADLNGDGRTDQADLAILLGAFGTCEGDPGYDARAAALAPPINCVDQADLAVLLADYLCGQRGGR